MTKNISKQQTYRDKIHLIAKKEKIKQKKGYLESILSQKLEVCVCCLCATNTYIRIIFPTLLIQKMTTHIIHEFKQVKYGTHTHKPLKKSMIRQVVKEYLNDYDSSSLLNTDTKLLDPILNSISNILQKKSIFNENSSKNSTGGHSQKTVMISCPSQVVPASNEGYNNGNIDRNEEISKLNPWKVLETYQMMKTNDTLKQEKEKIISDKNAMVQVLNSQVNDKLQKEKIQLQEKQRFIQNQTTEHQKWQIKQLEEKDKKHEKMRMLKQIRQEQILEMQDKRKKELSDRRQQELQDIAIAAKEVSDREFQLKQKRQEERKRWEHIKIENAKRQEQRKKIKEQEEAMDILQMKEYQEKLQLEDQRRQLQLQDRIAKSKLREVRLEGTRQLGDISEEDLEMKITRDFQERMNKNLDREMKKKEQRRMQIKDITEYNKQLAQTKLEIKQKMEKKERDHNIKLSRDTETAIIAEAENMRQKKLQGQKQYCQFLNEQMCSQTMQNGFENNMTDIEKSMNRKIFHKIEHDVELKKRILELIH